MADGLHAVVFVDNHDNQRGHGGNTVLTSQDDAWKYKVRRRIETERKEG